MKTAPGEETYEQFSVEHYYFVELLQPLLHLRVIKFNSNV